MTTTPHNAPAIPSALDARSHLPPPAIHVPESTAFAFLDGMVRTRSHSGEEAKVAAYIVGEMKKFGYDSWIDTAGNAVGTRCGAPINGKPYTDIVLMGHIDTVPGDVRIRRDGDLYYGRGSVDAKGPFATFVMGGSVVKLPAGIRLVVIGAVEEEAASSKGARQAAKDWKPAMCVIGEPSAWDGVTLGYKGRLLVEYKIKRPCSHSAGPEPTAAAIAAAWWDSVRIHAEAIGRGRQKSVFDRLQVALREFNTRSDGLHDYAEMLVSYRIPLWIKPTNIETACRELAGIEGTLVTQHEDEHTEVNFIGHEEAFATDRHNALVYAFTAAIREQKGKPKLRVKTGTADMNVVGPVWKCPIVAYGPGDSSLDHTPHEHLSIGEYMRAIEVLRSTVQRVADEIARPA